MEKIPVLLDTDAGSDIDDAVALAYLLRQPRCELLGVTTVSGEPCKRASIIDAVCRAAGRENVPIHAGAENPFLVSQKQPHAPQHAALGERWPHRTFAPGNTAIHFLRDTIRARPGEITLLAIGPLTNIALLFALYPEIPAMLRQLVLMGGQFLTRGYVAVGSVAEWNIECDPHAAAMVFNAPVPRLLAVGLDVTRECQMEPDECRARFAAAGGPLEPVAAMAEIWFKNGGMITFHDPLAAALIFEPGLCTTLAGRVDIELVSPLSKGQTLLSLKGPTPHEIAKSVDSERFFAHYFDMTGR